MRRQIVTDAEFVVVHDPRHSPVQWRPRPREEVSLQPLRKVVGWAIWSIIVATAVFTALIGLAGADLDTTEPERADVKPPPGVVAVPPVD